MKTTTTYEGHTVTMNFGYETRRHNTFYRAEWKCSCGVGESRPLGGGNVDQMKEDADFHGRTGRIPHIVRLKNRGTLEPV